MSAKVQYHALTVKYIIHTVPIHTLYLPFIINKEQKISEVTDQTTD